MGLVKPSTDNIIAGQLQRKNRYLGSRVRFWLLRPNPFAIPGVFEASKAQIIRDDHRNLANRRDACNI
eukprot:scaffold426575_cov30-Prasinocladus_malaysianus.AAC.1